MAESTAARSKRSRALQSFKETRGQSSLVGYVAVLAAATCWGTSGIFVRFIVDGSDVSALALAFWRDLFNIMVGLLGARREGVRVTVHQPDRAGEVARLTRAIAERGGYLSVFVTYPTADPDVWASVIKVLNVPEDTLVETLGSLPDIKVQDVRRM